jgi:hypothetical protein
MLSQNPINSNPVTHSTSVDRAVSNAERDHVEAVRVIHRYQDGRCDSNNAIIDCPFATDRDVRSSTMVEYPVWRLYQATF